MSTTTAQITVTVRFFAAARAAAGTGEQSVPLTAGATVADLAEQLTGWGPELARVLRRCSYLVDGVAVRDHTAALANAQTVDVLPPFAGG